MDALVRMFLDNSGVYMSDKEMDDFINDNKSAKVSESIKRAIKYYGIKKKHKRISKYL